ncbi:site-specific integrase [Enterococcus faecium]|uniref:Site-specific tyrosine recombinase XerC-family n=4 Tax=Enterococcus TaxID=1350 RepID=A0A828ZVY4_ENTFC|nr:site-specific integrase [Enterococcus faecium]ELB03235.1 site-specific tyrosine recombinase XerC-family [Enterococcus faecium EnGen0003]EMF0555106.1 site-specific integrase [Enterococcus faecium]MCL6157313.1 site-specific integrase [Enterococcus faecium]MCL6160940.1 site-specific integrase [Enterococcus faecium]MCU1842850.1 site-specific integrase [Enterococcus faecium]
MHGGVRKRGKRWYYYFEDINDDGSRKKVEKVGGDTRPEAEAALRKVLSDIDETGQYFLGTDTRVKQYLDFWMEEYVKLNLKYNTYENYRFTIKNHINGYLGKKKLTDLSPALLQNFINAEFKKGYSKKTMTITHSVLKNALNMAVYPWGLIKQNPMLYVKIPKYEERPTTKKDLKIISLEDFDHMLEITPEGHPFYIPLNIGFYTGMRVGEVCGLTWDNVDFSNGTITVEKQMVKNDGAWVYGTPKTSSSNRTIFIGQTLLAILKKHKKQQLENRMKYGKLYIDSNAVCTKEYGELVTPSVVKWNTRRISNALSLSFNFHSLRHTHATLLLENGAKMKEISDRLGHSRISITMDTYSHVTDKMRNETVDIMENLRKNS